MEYNSSAEYDIAIVGGGIAGIYAAWRLLMANTEDPDTLKSWRGSNKSLRIALFEGSNRIGGRLLSALPPNMPHMICEIGGMRYVSSQKLVSGLVENALNLPRHPQDVDEPINIAYLRGKRLRTYQLSDPSVLPYQLSGDETAWLQKGNKASNLIGWAVEQLVPEVKNLSGTALQEYLKTAEVDGIPLYHYGFWNLVAKAMSFEAYQIAIKTVGYDSLGMNANAANSIAEYFDFTPDVNYYLLNDGYDAVPWTLQQQFEDGGGEVHLQSWLQGFDETKLADGSKGVQLHFRQGKTIRAKALILAMPPRSIALLRQQGPVLDPEKAPHFQYLLNAVQAVGLYKMFLVYEKPWWEQAFVTKGRSLTDLPVRQCYYWGVENRLEGGDPSSTHAVIMAYNDMQSSEFWGGLRMDSLGPNDAVDWTINGDKTIDDLHTKTAVFKGASRNGGPKVAADGWKQRLLDNWKAHPAPLKMVDEMHRQLVEIHGIKDAPYPIDAAFVDWSDDPYGGAVHFWNTGYKSWEVMDAIVQPVGDFPCFLCGEAFSTNQTWVEGALQTAEIVLQKHFGLSQPKWLSND